MSIFKRHCLELELEEIKKETARLKAEADMAMFRLFFVLSLLISTAIAILVCLIF
jgi:hypothetical protein